ncbi:MAG: branched-chain amino acid ABC transporter permease [Actinobacteria bacterium]|nr:branched-chain amino acid ABC transporter permease [Actinomycetota bacterium]
MSTAKRYMPYIGPLILGVVLCLLPPILDERWKLIFLLVFIWAFLAMGWNILGGYCGQHSLGHGLYMGIGAYLTAYFFQSFGLTPWLGMIIAMAASAFTGWFIGWVVFRYQLKGAYFALVTIAIAEMAVYIVSNISALGGAAGIQEDIKYGIAWLQSPNKAVYFYAGIGLVVGGLLLTQYLSKQRFFYYLQAVRENEDAAEALGVDTVKEKIKASVWSAVWCALGGVFYVQYFMYVGPRSVFGETISVQILLFAIIGGLSTVWGPFVGALILVPITEITRSELGTVFQGASLLIYGAAMVLAMLFMPYGILGLAKRLQERYRNKRSSNNLAPRGAQPEGGEAS